MSSMSSRQNLDSDSMEVTHKIIKKLGANSVQELKTSMNQEIDKYHRIHEEKTTLIQDNNTTNYFKYVNNIFELSGVRTHEYEYR